MARSKTGPWNYLVKFLIVVIKHALDTEWFGYCVDAILHHRDPLLAVVVVSRKNLVDKSIPRNLASLASCSSKVAGTVSSPIAQPFTPWLQASGHQPSSTLRFRTPFMAAFIPEVPQAS